MLEPLWVLGSLSGARNQLSGRTLRLSVRPWVLGLLPITAKQNITNIKEGSGSKYFSI